MLSHTGAPHNNHFLLFNCSGVLKISQKVRLFIQDPFKLFGDCYLVQAISFNRCNLSFKSFQWFFLAWALTHRSFPRILHDSSFSGVILKFISKFDVRMCYHHSNVFHQDLSNYFHRSFNLSNFHSGVPQQFMEVLLIAILII